MTEKPSFLKNHADTLAIIGVNMAMFAILVTMWVTNISSINAVNCRMDAANTRMDTIHMMIYDILKEGKK
jgi:hypothetical protein